MPPFDPDMGWRGGSGVDMGLLAQRVLGSVATAALLGIFALGWNSYQQLQELVTAIEVIKVSTVVASKEAAARAADDVRLDLGNRLIRLESRVDQLTARQQHQ